MGERLAELDVVDDVGDEAGPDRPGLNPDPPHDHLDVGVHEGPATDLDRGVTRELGETPAEYLVTELRQKLK